MRVEISSNLKVICTEITKQCAKPKLLPDRYDFLQLCDSANAIERYLLAKYFCKTTWNIGSLSVLSILQELRILTATEFILSLEDTNEIQLILNDFLEDEYQLLSNLFIASYYDSSNSVKLSAILDECLKNLYKDVLENPSLSDLKYLKATKKHLPMELLLKLTHKHINIVLDLNTSNLRDAFQYFSKWINEGVDNIQFIKDFYEQLIIGNEQIALNQLFTLSTVDHFKEWKFYLILVQTIASKSVDCVGAFIRKHLETRLRHIASVPCKNAFLNLLLTARAATATTMDVQKNIDAYAHWYKQNIGEMKILLKGEEFKNIIKLLDESVDYEFEQDYLEVHSLISISPPVYCGKFVQAYKSKCKLRLSQIKTGLKSQEMNESILIEDSD